MLEEVFPFDLSKGNLRLSVGDDWLFVFVVVFDCDSWACELDKSLDVVEVEKFVVGHLSHGEDKDVFALVLEFFLDCLGGPELLSGL